MGGERHTATKGTLRSRPDHLLAPSHPERERCSSQRMRAAAACEFSTLYTHRIAATGVAVGRPVICFFWGGCGDLRVRDVVSCVFAFSCVVRLSSSFCCSFLFVFLSIFQVFSILSVRYIILYETLNVRNT